jgi:hypothetical protein
VALDPSLIPEFPTAIILPLVIAEIAAIIIYKKKMKKQQK